MRRTKQAVNLLIIVVVAISTFGWYEIRRGFSARTEPSEVETLMATTARMLAVPSNYRQLHNPLLATPETIQAGMEHFADHCAVCHSNDGGGDTMFGKGLYPRPPDMRKAETQAKTDGELYYTIENGVRLTGMPAFGEHPGTNDADTWKLVVFIRHLPALTAQELAQMGALNPKTEEERLEEKQEEEFLNGENSPSNSKKEQSHHQLRRKK